MEERKRVDDTQSREVSVRKAQPDDAEQMHDVHVWSVKMLCTGDYTPEQIETWVGKLNPEKRRQRMRETEAIIFVAEKEEKIVGFSSLSEKKVRAVYVHPGYTRQGVGTILLDAVEREAMAHHIQKLELQASVTAVSFYQARGYKLVERSHYMLSGVEIPCAYLEKSLLPTK
ncbi:MAG: hypothetical protein BRC40_04740 [Cyanobacteria bacterium QH_8_48_120]|jgi:putative acetyltransferase|nr:MAG: hypothetical protein BRC34_16055 [Cyanobacteria bacterium QH_1_48_107]PSO66864.1 MAG: hypothetical protein BRC39_02420 [Cyanobacteria bacterium QH_7_48_89]PSO68921.1 MAG: hypothetical protein BRC38_00895 [Cyanobacteria bacterium QH_6_48_35]PSO75623.1 MAG: hypothetical protein BRC40_04740 [Cyanobacteria bacterium QH_8_48_120]PSP36106.1 MAG: hypothetical protein BRC57_03360 [Cyanobacteria bacterium QS_8_48_54]